ncbi:MAG: UDP-glucose/GDP-mannose dehydrogenase family protein [Gammaproteobacteria bacterium]|jgi:UDPglucose 6-dehydrogenase|nr:UDP-glucose/GDP-mannose dehydrogenase family protein [Gammaproteobacteria bacterium]
MKISVFGAGYVGLVTATCFAELGNHVICADINEARVQQLQRGECPIHEPGLTELMQQNIKAGRLEFTTDAKFATQQSLLLFIAVGTPSSADGSADLSHVFSVAKTIGEHMTGYNIIIDKSTVPVGTAAKVKAIIAEKIHARGLDIEFDIASNPEFLREGVAIEDFMQSSRIILGTESERAQSHLLALYAHFNRNGDRVICMDPASAELTKYAANAMLATRISFMNELALLSEKVGADIEFVRRGIGSDPRIGLSFLNAGCGYGGSCFPKDVQALEHTALENHVELSLIRAIHDTNEKQKYVLFEKIKQFFAGDLKGKTIALWGLAFKPDTDDMREAPSRTLMENLWQHGVNVRAYDPVASHEALRIYGQRPDFILCNSAEEALSGADILVIVTEWKLFASPDFELIRNRLKYPVIFDGRNLYDPNYVKSFGVKYFGIGRGEVL